MAVLRSAVYDSRNADNAGPPLRRLPFPMICNPRQGSCGIPVLAVVATMAVIPLMAQESLEGVARPDTTRPNTHYVR